MALSSKTFFGATPWPFMTVVGFALAPWAYAWGNEGWIVLLVAAVGALGAVGWLQQSVQPEGEQHDA